MAIPPIEAHWLGMDGVEPVDKLDGAGYSLGSALSGRLPPAAREASHLAFEFRHSLPSFSLVSAGHRQNMKGGLVTPSKFLPLRSSFESIRKQAKKLAREFATADAHALARVHAQLPTPAVPLPLRDAQLVLAREYGFAGWQDLRAAALRLEGKGLEWAAAEAERAIHDDQVERLTQLVHEYPALLSWRS